MYNNYRSNFRKLLHSLGEFVRSEPGRRSLAVFLFSLLFVSVLLTMVGTVARRGKSPELPDTASTLTVPNATNTKWWLRNASSSTPTPSLNPPAPIGTPADTTVPEKCPAYAAGFQPGTYGYVSLFPPYGNLIRSGAGKDYSTVGYIQAGDWLKILDFPVCSDNGYVWLKVQSAGSSIGWTAGGRDNRQWVMPCSDPHRKCIQKQQAWRTSVPKMEGNNSGDDHCVSARLAVGVNAQVGVDALLVVRTEPYAGSILGYISPASVVTVIGGPACRAGAVWWQVTSENLSGWAVENLLKACAKDGDCRGSE